MIGVKMKEKMRKELEIVEDKCNANLLTVEEIENKLLDAKDIMSIFKGEEFRVRYLFGKRKGGYNYVGTSFEFEFNKNLKIKSFRAWRSKCGYEYTRVILDRPLTMPEKRLLKKLDYNSVGCEITL